MLKRIADMFGTDPAVASKAATRTRLSIEPLEERSVPATWTAATVAELVQHINDANGPGYPGADTITLTPGTTYTLTAANNTADGGNGLPVIAEGLTIVGNGATIARSTAKETPAFRIFDVAAGVSLTVHDLTLQGGQATQGGAVFNQGTLTFRAVTVQGNTARGYDGFNDSSYNLPGGDAAGGGIYSNGTLVMEGCTVRNNAAVGGRGAKAFTFTNWFQVKVTVAGSDGGNAFGGGVYVGGGSATITNSDITSNSAKGGAGGNQGGSNGQGHGGGVYIAPATGVTLDAFTRDHVTQNTAPTSAPNIYGTYTVV